MITNRIDGKLLAEKVLLSLKDRVRKLPSAPRVQIIIAGIHPTIELFVRSKMRSAQKAGIVFSIGRVPENVSTEELISTYDSTSHAIIVQLPLPEQVDTDAVLSAIPVEKDADVLSSEMYKRFVDGAPSALVPPVVFAVQQVLASKGVALAGKHTLVVGDGMLVGKPVSTWFSQQGADVRVITSATRLELPDALKIADIVVSGAGVPNLIKPEHLKEGVMLIDAGTSELGGTISGDIDPSCSSLSSLFTPVPGGIGPLTVVGVLSNIVTLAERKFA